MVYDTATLITHSRTGSLISHWKLVCIHKPLDLFVNFTTSAPVQIHFLLHLHIAINDFHQEFFLLIHLQHKMDHCGPSAELQRVFFTLAYLWFKEEVHTRCWCPMILWPPRKRLAIGRKPRTFSGSCRSMATASQGQLTLFHQTSWWHVFLWWTNIMLDLAAFQRAEGFGAGLVLHGEEVRLQVPQKAAEVRRLSSGVHRSLGYVEL